MCGEDHQHHRNYSIFWKAGVSFNCAVDVNDGYQFIKITVKVVK
jgi:high-affinity Fe2+/Pb2+ permease